MAKNATAPGSMRYAAPPNLLDVSRFPSYFESAFSLGEGVEQEKVSGEARNKIAIVTKRVGMYLREARDVSEPKEIRTNATNALITFYRLRLRYGSTERGREMLAYIDLEAQQINVDIRLSNFWGGICRQVLMADDPAKALAASLRLSPRRGPKEKYAYRDRMIAADVQELNREGKTLAEAYDTIQRKLTGAKAVRGVDAIRKAHAKIMADKDGHPAVNAELAFRKLESC